MTAGFVHSQILAALVRLGVLERLTAAPASTAVLAGDLGVPERAMAALMQGAEALDLVERHVGDDGGDVWLPAVRGAALVANPGAVAMIRHHDRLYRDLADPVRLAREGVGADGEAPETARLWAYARDPGAASGLARGFDRAAVDHYSELMGASLALLAEDVLDRLSMRGVASHLDIGGGEGAFVAACARRYPGLRLGLVDLPAVAERARERLAAQGLAERVAVRGGDFFADPAPFSAEGGADSASLVRVLYDHDDEHALAILTRARASLAPGGRLAVAEPMAGLPGARRTGAYFALYLLAMGSGRLRTPAEIARLMRAAGFARPRPVATARPMLTGLMVARA
ncbi:MAG: methyltransferase [Paracoccaceae bacterium]